MTAFVVCDLEGFIQRTGSCPPDMIQAQAAGTDELAFELTQRVNERTDKINPRTGEVLKDVLTPPELTNEQLRRKEYPSVHAQLDAIWSGPEAVAEMQATIDAIKAKYPV